MIVQLMLVDVAMITLKWVHEKHNGDVSMDRQTEMLGNAKSVDFHDINKETLSPQHPLSVIKSTITINSNITKCGRTRIIVLEIVANIKPSNMQWPTPLAGSLSALLQK